MMIDHLKSSIDQGNVILFVGAGVSMNLGVPSWDSLMDRIATELNYNPEEFRSLGNHYALAEYYRVMRGSIGPLRSWMDREWHAPDIDIAKSKVHELIVKANFPIIYTTNYDRWLEAAHRHYGKPFTKISSVADLTKIRSTHTQVVKFHGDFDDDRSIVLDETSYFERLEFETPLDIKLRADVLGKSVLFIGYSLADTNLRFLFYKLSKLWKAHPSEEAQPRSYIFSWRPNPVQERILNQWGITMISSDLSAPGAALENFLTKLA